MEQPGFLEKLYTGKFDENLFSSCHGQRMSEKAKGILDEYLYNLNKFSSVQLEESGKLPRELWEGLKSSGMFAGLLSGEASREKANAEPPVDANSGKAYSGLFELE